MDIRDYLQRIRYRGSLEPTLQTLRALHEAHLLTVPFENLSIHYGQPIILQEALLFNKIVRKHRGGFCYELNGLFAWLLGQSGFQVTLLSAEVAGDASNFSPEFDHLTLLVHRLSGTNWLADVGFGDSFLHPLRFEAEVEQKGADGKEYRLQRKYDEHTQRDYWIVQQLSDATWQPQYRFTVQPHTLADFTERCIYQQTSPESHFTRQRICSLATPTGRISLSDLRLITTIHGERKEQVLTSEEEYIAVLAEQFGVVI
ncbi:MAG TPA: arylamine N-acetyltransferase [Ktedonobacteraceae bacterium]|nr:arylamine N-acetyltransferase [Ktedonobacteraceae bacterium]